MLTLSVDVHPDPFYVEGTDPDGDHPCHQGDGGDAAGYYGAPTTRCDSPYTLVNATFKWIQDNIKDDIDFVIWTGDSARHDNDEDIPRTSKQIRQLNRFVVHKFVEVFGKLDNINDTDPTNDFVVPIVPTYGNNDILPHNIFQPGPNQWTKDFTEIWSKFIPESQMHSFARGGWFWSEVIPNRLAVISLNTLFFFENNAAVDGCDLKSEPGYEHMEWLRIQLQFMRERGLKAFLVGHVPPARTESKQNWDETCYQKYTLWLRQYRDVIVGNMFGHMNLDHFMFQDVRDLTYDFKIEGIDDEGLRSNHYDPHPHSNEDFNALAKNDYLSDLRTAWGDLPTPPKGMAYNSAHDSAHLTKSKSKRRDKFFKEIGGPYGERFSMTIVSPSVIPNFFPTLRIIEYNVTGLENDHPAIGMPQGISATNEDLIHQYDINELEDNAGQVEDDIDEMKKKKKKKGKKHKPKPGFPVPAPPSKSAPPGPAYSPQTFSLLSWTQLYANLTKIHEDIAADLTVASNADADKKANRRDAHFDFKVEYRTNHDKSYQMADLTVRQWLDLAERIGREKYKGGSIDDVDPTKKKKKKKKGQKDRSNGKLKDNHLWHEFVRRAFVFTKGDADLEDDFD